MITAMDWREKDIAYIEKLCSITGKKYSRLAIDAGLAPSTVNRFVRDTSIRNLSGRVKNALAVAAGFQDYDDFLMHESGAEVLEIPVKGEVPGGGWEECFEQNDGKTIPFPTKRKGAFALRVRGESMNRIAADGQYIIVDRETRLPDRCANKAVVVECDGEVTFKIYRRNPDRFEPHSTAPDYQTIYPKNEWRIIGRVIGAVSYMED